MSSKVHYNKLFRFFLVGIVLISIRVDAQKKPGFGNPTGPPKKRGSQIVDDSTKNVYGPKTTLWTTEENLFINKKNSYIPLDTSITNYHRWTYVQRFNNYYKDLGNNGTALSPIFPLLSETIGFTSGFNSYTPYFQTELPHYYDSRSPYTRIHVVWGGNGRAMTRIEYTRPINPRWNFGFDYRPLLSDKQIQYKKADRQTISHYYDIYTTYKSTDTRYLLLFNYRRIRHRVFENGGVDVKAGQTYVDFFDKTANIHLKHAVTEDKRSNVHLFQQYRLANAAQLYLTSDYFLQVNKFGDQMGGSGDPYTYFDYTRGDSLNANDRVQLDVFQNEAGMKGNAGPLFYNFYYKNRSYQYVNTHSETKAEDVTAFRKTGTERYFGGRVGLTFDSLTALTGGAEYLLDGNYKLDADWKSPWIDASWRSSLSKPGMMQQVYYGSHDLWTNSFNDVSALQLKGFLKAQFGPLFISPGATFTTLKNYIFFKEDPTSPLQKVLPIQSSGNQTIFSPELRMTARVLRNIYIRPQVIYTYMLKNDDDAFHIPTTFVNAQIAFENTLFKKAIQVQIGVDLHWKSTYNAMAYDVSTQQFYIQNRTDDTGGNFIPGHAVSSSYLLADVFFNAKLRRGKFFIKYHNVVQAVSQMGYVPTPDYQGQHSVMDFGFDLILFD